LFKNADSSSDGEFSSLSDEEISKRSSRSERFNYQSFSLVNNNNNNNQDKAQSPSRRTPLPLQQQQQQQPLLHHHQQQQQQQSVMYPQQHLLQQQQPQQKQQQSVLEIVDETDGTFTSSDNNSNSNNSSSRLQRVAVMEQKLWDIKHKSIPTRKSLLKPISTTTTTSSQNYKIGQVNNTKTMKICFFTKKGQNLTFNF
jgi:hypothetical protein